MTNKYIEAYILTYYKLVEISSKIKLLLDFFARSSFTYSYYIGKSVVV